MQVVDIGTPDTELPREGWWAVEGEAKAASALWGTFSLLIERDSARRRVQALYTRMYSNASPAAGAGEAGYVRMLPDGSLVLNVAQRVGTRALSRVIVNRPKAVVQTIGGNASLRRQARMLERFVDGEFYRLGMPKEALRVAEESMALGKGLLKVYRAPGPGGKSQAFIERTLTEEIVVDRVAGRYGKPQELYQVKFYPRNIDPGKLGVGKDDRDKVAAMLRSATAGGQWQLNGREAEADQVAVVEGWHLPDATWDGESDEGAGRHVVCLSNGPVVSEPWRYRYFPFVEMDWGKPLWGGFWGQGLVEQVAPLQFEINKLLLRIQQAMHLISVPRILCEAGSRIAPSQVSNQVAQLLHYVGTKPEFMVAQAMHPEVFQHIWQLYQRAMELAGDDDQPVPRQIRSGVGLTKAHAMQSLRLAGPIQAWDEFHCETARRIIDIYREIHAEEGFTAVLNRDKYTVEEVDWSEVDLADETYVMRVYPASALSQDPVSRQEQVTELLQNGLVSPETGARLLDFPDLEHEADLARAAADNIDRQIEAMVDEGEYQPPEPYQDLALAIKRAQATYNRIERDDPSEEREERMQLLRDYMNAAMELMKRAAAAAQAQMAPVALPPGTPPAPGPSGAPPMAAGGPV